MFSESFAISVSNTGKRFEIYANPRDRLKQFLLPRARRLLGLRPHKYFKEFWAVKDVSFEIKKGETVGIIGRNGSGKSTLLQMICGTLTPTNGSIQTNGRIAALLELGSGFNPEFTGRENVYMNAAVLGLSKKEIDTRFNDIIAFADIGEFIEQPVKTYSSGMMVRLAFAVIAHVDADILVVDEALAVGDAFFTQKCMRFLRNYMKTGTVLFVSHDTSAVLNLCGHAIWLHAGKVELSGHPKQVIEKYLEKQYFEDQPAATQGLSSLPNIEEVQPHGSKLPVQYKDQRLDIINSSPLRNDIEVFKFEYDKYAYGSGLGEIVNTYLTDDEGKPLSWIVGGEMVSIATEVTVSTGLNNLLFGFAVKDRLGQVLFGDNSFLTYMNSPIDALENQRWVVNFIFRMPILPVGDYSIDVTFGSGTQTNHVIHHWVRDALLIKSHASSTHTGLVGIPLLKILAHTI